MNYTRQLFLLILAAGLAIRLYNFPVWNGFDYDQEINAWLARSIVVDHKPVLIGPETSLGGMYVGPFFNYVIALFFALGRMDPAATTALNALLFVATLLIFSKVAGDLFGPRARLIAISFYAFSAMIIGYDRILWNPTPIPLVSILLFYFLVRFIETSRLRDLFLASFFLGLMFHLHFQAILIGGIFFLCLMMFKTKSLLRPKTYLVILPTLLVFFLPLIIFDLRHDFINSRHLAQFFFARSAPGGSIDLAAFFRTITILTTSLRDVIYNNSDYGIRLVSETVIVLPVVVAGYILKNLKVTIFRITLVSLLVALVTFTFYKGPLPTQYYFLFLYPLFILAASSALSKLPPKIVYPLVALFAAGNVWQILFIGNDLSLENKHRAVEFITRKAGSQSFKVDMITAPGLATGYKYLFWLEGANPSFDYLAPAEKSFKMVIPATIARPEELSARFGSIGIVESN